MSDGEIVRRPRYDALQVSDPDLRTDRDSSAMLADFVPEVDIVIDAILFPTSLGVWLT